MFDIILNETKDLIDHKYSSYFKNKKILILGFSGIVGQYFAGFFLNLLNTNYSPKSITLVSKNKIPNYLNFLKKIKKITIIKTDITKANFKEFNNYDCIIFSAGYGQPGKFLKNPIETVKLNTITLDYFINKLSPKGKFLYMSTSEIYNKNFNKNLSENEIGLTNTNDPRASYIEAKRCGETIINIYRNNKEAKSIRLCLAYGPGSKKDDVRVLYEFIESAIKNKTIKIQDSGLAKRRYIYIADALKMMLNILVFGKHATYNVSGKESITIRQLAKKIANIFKIKIQIKKKNILLGSPKNTSLSIKRYESEFGEIKFTKIDDGLIKTINWHKLLKT